MSGRVQVPMTKAAMPARSIRPARAATLQRKCTCSGAGGECAECRKQRLSTTESAPGTAPPIVHEALRSPGQPLDSATRAYFEPRFGHDFSKVRLHSDAKAAESAHAVNALAYTVGNDIVFAKRPSGPGAGEDTRVLAHELTHVLQQPGGAASHASLRIGSADSAPEREADHVANAVMSNRHEIPSVHAGTTAVQRDTPKTQTSGQTQPDPVWGSKKWPGYEDDWNALYQLAVQGLAGGNLKPEQIGKLAGMVADLAMGQCMKHGKEFTCAKAAAPDKDTKMSLDITLPWGPTGTWGQTFRSAIQSTVSGVDGPNTGAKAVQRAADIADQASRGMLSTAAWQLYMNCKTPDAAKSTTPPPKTATGHS